MSKVHLLLLPHEDEHACHRAIQRHLVTQARGHLRLLAATTSEWGKAAMHALTTDQGFTCHDHLGDGPKGGYMVSFSKKTEKVIAVADITPADIAAYRDKHKSALANPNNYLGAWVYEGNVYLDVSTHVTSLEDAMAKAKANSQLGVYDIANGKTIDTADYFDSRKAAALSDQIQAEHPTSSRVYWKSANHDLDAVNKLRARAGLRPVVHDTTGAIARAALRLVSGGGEKSS